MPYPLPPLHMCMQYRLSFPPRRSRSGLTFLTMCLGKFSAAARLETYVCILDTNMSAKKRDLTFLIHKRIVKTIKSSPCLRLARWENVIHLMGAYKNKSR